MRMATGSELQRGSIVQLRITDVERLKKKVRKMAAGRVLSGGSTDVGLDLAQVDGCRACIKAGYGQLGKTPQPIPRDRLIWILDGYAEIYDTAGGVTNVRQGESTILSGGQAYRLVFPQLSLYLSVEATEKK
jgi:hypothetical protein